MREPAEERPVWAWIDLDALSHNARRAIDCAAGRTVIGVVKADGYGHGAAEIARGLMAEGIARLAVVSVAEGAELRRAGIVAPVLLLGGFENAATAERALKWGLTPGGIGRSARPAGPDRRDPPIVTLGRLYPSRARR